MERKKAVKEVPMAFTRRYTLVEGVCPVCGKTFEGTRRKRYCSAACRNLAGWRRNGPAYMARKRGGQKASENTEG